MTDDTAEKIMQDEIDRFAIDYDVDKFNLTWWAEAHIEAHRLGATDDETGMASYVADVASHPTLGLSDVALVLWAWFDLASETARRHGVTRWQTGSHCQP